MKKIASLVAIMSLVAATSAFAATSDPSSNGSSGKSVKGDGKPIGKLSANVTLGAEHDATGYAITTFHGKGTKKFGTSHDSTAIYSIDATANAAPDASDSTAFDGWTAM